MFNGIIFIVARDVRKHPDREQQCARISRLDVLGVRVKVRGNFGRVRYSTRYARGRSYLAKSYTLEIENKMDHQHY